MKMKVNKIWQKPKDNPRVKADMRIIDYSYRFYAVFGPTPYSLISSSSICLHNKIKIKLNN